MATPEIDGAELVAEARRAVSEYLADGRLGGGGESFRRRYGFPSGVFVTITRDGELRGCIGYPEASGRLCEMLPEAAVAAATRDPRFPPVGAGEMDKVSFEVTVLEPPELVLVGVPDEYLGKIVPGRDGLIIRYQGSSGLLLPQVATGYGWSAQELLENTCRKAGLPGDQWRHPGIEVWRFGGRVFGEDDDVSRQ